MHRSGNVPFYPQDHLTPYILEGFSLCPGRFSDFPALLATFPFIRKQWYAMAKRVPFSSKIWKKAGLQRRARPRISRGSLLISYEHLNRSIQVIKKQH
jgi:UPF0716 family protein affecting phage T7 exclusion